MNNSNKNHLNLLDLPDEVLLVILKKLNMVGVFYSLADVNQRFNRLVLDSSYIRDLDMTINSVYDQASIDTQEVLSSICQKILPCIHHQVHKLTVEECSMKQILLAVNYPQLYSLSLINFQKETLLQDLTGDLILRDLLTKQITHLNIDIKNTVAQSSKAVLNILALILSSCKRLIDLNFCDFIPTRKYSIPVSNLPSTTYISSTLIKLKINVLFLTDCLFLLDGCLDCLSTLIINVDDIYHPGRYIDRTKKLPKLKCFSLTTFRPTHEYDILIIPLLCRMINLEILKLCLPVNRVNSTYIDGFQLFDRILIYMTQLNKFIFSIDTTVCNESKMGLILPSNEDIQRSFIGRGYQQVASYVHTNLMHTQGKCHIYSLPYELEYFVNLDNSFQGGMFHKVRYLKMADMRPFEHKLFQLISQDFPFLELLYLTNTYPQKNKQHLSTLITFPYLTLLDLKLAHVDYAKQFLLKKNIHLPCLLSLCIEYESLEIITNKFTNDAACFNFSKLKSLDVCQPFVRPSNFHQYFPLL